MKFMVSARESLLLRNLTMISENCQKIAFSKIDKESAYSWQFNSENELWNTADEDMNRLYEVLMRSKAEISTGTQPVEQVLLGGGLLNDAKNVVDPWGMPYLIGFVINEDKDGKVNLVCTGPDGETGGSDDILWSFPVSKKKYKTKGRRLLLSVKFRCPMV